MSIAGIVVGGVGLLAMGLFTAHVPLSVRRRRTWAAATVDS